jgi:hypothetical protein
MADPEAGAQAASDKVARSAKGGSSWLKGEQFGMPRWVWLALLAGGIALGLYLRAREAAEEVDEEFVDAPISGEEDGLGVGYEDPGMAGVGVLSPGSGSVVPVSTPMLPEGLMDVFGAIGGTLADVAIEGRPPPVQMLPPRRPPTPPTGGGPPNRPPQGHPPLTPREKAQRPQSPGGRIIVPPERARLPRSPGGTKITQPEARAIEKYRERQRRDNRGNNRNNNQNRGRGQRG